MKNTPFKQLRISASILKVVPGQETKYVGQYWDEKRKEVYEVNEMRLYKHPVAANIIELTSKESDSRLQFSEAFFEKLLFRGEFKQIA